MANQNRKQRAATRIQSIRSKLDSGSTKSQLKSFLTDYFLCEMACKEMVVGYQDSIGKSIKYEEVKMDLRVLKAAFNIYGIALTDVVRNRLFSSSPKSAKKLRDSLVHGISKNNLDTLVVQYGTMMSDMKVFLDQVTK